MEDLKKEGVNVRSLDEAPVLLPSAAWLYSAFETLSAKRLFIDGRPQPIQISEILAYAEFEEITDKTMRDDLMYMVGVMDAKFLNFHLNKPSPKGPKDASRMLPRNR